MVCLKSMALGESIDKQRETRWPHQTSATEPKVVWTPYEEDSDGDAEEDPEDIMREAGDPIGYNGFDDREYP